MQYNTKNRKIVAEIFTQNKDEWYSAEKVAEKANVVAKSSVYRLLGEMCESGFLVREYSEKLGCAVYRLDSKPCHEHFHLKCVDCGKYVHVHDRRTEELINSIAASNEFSVDKGKTVLYGVCDDCRKREIK